MLQDPGCLQALLGAGADACARDAARVSPLHNAVCCGNARCIELLLEAGEDIDCRQKHEQARERPRAQAPSRPRA